MISKYAIIQNKKIHYRTGGKGNPVILIHGFAEDSRVWKYQQEALSKKCRLIIPDLPGSGHSEMIEDMSIEGLSECIRQLLLIELNNPAQHIIIIGHSMGGYISLAFAERHPEMLAAFGLFHSTAYADNDEKIATRQRGIEFIRKHGSYAFLQQSAPNLFSGTYRTKHAAIVNNMIEEYKDFNPMALTGYYEAMIQRPDRTAVLKSFSKPILFIIGKQDKAIPFEDSMQQCHLPQLSYIHILEETSHMGMWEEKNKSNIALASFLQNTGS